MPCLFRGGAGCVPERSVRSAEHGVVGVLRGVAPEPGGGEQVVDEGLQRRAVGGAKGDEPFPGLVRGPDGEPVVADAPVGDVEKLPLQGGLRDPVLGEAASDLPGRPGDPAGT